MLNFLRGRGSERKLLLFAVACCRRAWQALQAGDERACPVVEIAERYADGRPGGLSELWAALSARRKGRPGRPRRESREAMEAVGGLGIDPAWPAAVHVSAGAQALVSPDGVGAEQRAQAALLRDIFGNPFRPSAIEPAWRTPDVLRLAEAAYEERSLPSGHLDNTNLAVLADALEEIGSPGPLLEHLRSPGPHVRGCHAVDAVLGKE
jgi:hypothetical protein